LIVRKVTGRFKRLIFKVQDP